MSTLYPNGGFTKFPNSLRSRLPPHKHNDIIVYWYLRLHAQHFTSRWNDINLEPGQLITGRKAIAEVTRLSEQEVRTALKHLESDGHITTKSTNKYTIISFTDKENWSSESNLSTSKSPAEPPASNQQPTSKQPADNQHFNQCSNQCSNQPSNQQTTKNQPHIENKENKRQGEGEEDDAAAAAALDNINDLIRRYRLTDSEATLDALLEDANAYGFDVLEAALKKAANSNSRERISVNFYRAILNGNGKQAEAYDPYAGVPVIGKA